MTIALKDLRQTIGRELGGLILTGTATSVDSVNDDDIVDTSSDSPLDAGDSADRLEDAGLLVHNPTGTNTLEYRTGITYEPVNQRLSWATAAAIGGLTGTPEYEVYREPLLHPLLIFTHLVNDALRKIKRLAFPHILLNNRGYYDLSRYPDITGSERVRRLYYAGPNLLSNADFNVWPTGADRPSEWSGSGIPSRQDAPNYPHAVQLGPTNYILQSISVGGGPRRLRVAVWALTQAGATAALSVTPLLAGGGSESWAVAQKTIPANTTGELVCEVETTSRTVAVNVQLTSSGGTSEFWAPMAYDLSLGRRRRIQPITVMNEDGNLRLYCLPRTGVAQFALLLPYPQLTVAATTANDAQTIDAPDDLIIAATAVEVLRWLLDNPDIPSSSKAEYDRMLRTWASKFRQRAREHMRKIAKTQQVWEAGELN